MSYIRLDRYLADTGEGTRTQVKQIIRRGSVVINENVIRKPEYKVDTETDCVYVDGKKVLYEEYQYYMLNKPAGAVSARTDNKDKTVIEIIDEGKRRDLFPVGRLDKDTEGLLVITNDGKLANNLLAPGKHVDKCYYAKINGRVTAETVQIFKNGVDIGDDTLTAPAKLELLKSVCDEEEWVSEIKVIITEGRYHQIKRMFKAVGMQVIYLKRLSMGKLVLDERLLNGEYRKLTDDEIMLLKENGKDGSCT